MIRRYTPKEMGGHWSDQSKYDHWLRVSLAILETKAEMGMIPLDAVSLIHAHATVDVERVEYWDEGPGGMRHDMQAFTETVKESLRAAAVDEEVVALFNKDVTSYDIEDSALSLMLCEAVGIIMPLISGLEQALFDLAKEHEETLMMGLTHGQPAEATTLALKLLNFREMVKRDYGRLIVASEAVRVGRLAGAVGNYGHLGPEAEAITCERLRLRSGLSTQIIHRDVHANLMDTLATAAANIGHIAHNLWLMCQWPRCEAREPFGKNQRGSTQMPHKKNPITLERLRGMAQQMIGYQTVAKMAVITYDERAIDQSCQERINWPDAFCLLAYMLEKLTKLLPNMVFFPQAMQANIEKTKGQLGSSYVKDLLLSQGVTHLVYGDEEVQTYDWVKNCAHEAWERQVHLSDVLIERGILEMVSAESLEACFDLHRGLEHLSEIYDRYGL